MPNARVTTRPKHHWPGSGRPAAKSRRTLAVLVLLGTLCGPMTPLQAAAIDRDVVVYGGTAAGAMAGVAAARHGASVILLEPGRHIGGMVSGGLGRFDVDRQKDLIGGLTLEFFTRLGRHYGQTVSWACEPHVAEDVFRTMLKEAGVELRFGQLLAAAEADGTCLRVLRMRDGTTYSARVFIDATYEGDLLKAAGVSYTIGREGRDQYDESLAGRRELLPGHHQFVVGVSPWRDGALLPYVTPQEKLVPVGAGDDRLQAYCFRLCLTDRAENRVPITRPKDYDPARYELLRRYLLAIRQRKGEPIRGPVGFARIPNGKCDANSSGAVSLNLPGANQEYPEATPERRAEIREEHRSWAHGLLFFLQNDPAVPEEIRAACAPWGLCKDEFQDTGGWPHQLYVREARRMLGEYILTQHDLQQRRRKHDVIGMAGYNIDIREVQWVSVRTFRFPDAQDETFVEGYVSQPVEPWDIPYRAILPRYSECSNLLVPVCISASTVAYASFRMEPNYMIVGHSAGVAAALA
ncbi:MAG: FAD-dependent oxidoreductase, partial [Phycisphaerae bacterium]